MRKITKRVILALVIEFASFIFASLISFLIFRMLPGDPVLAYLPSSWSPEMYDAMSHMLGFDGSIIEQFLKYVGEMLTGNWRYSLNISMGVPVFDLIIGRIPPTIYLTVLPLILGLFLGFFLGNHSIKIKFRIGNRTVQIVSLLGFALPIMILALLSQFFVSFINPIFDLVLLWIALTISITALTTFLVRTYLTSLIKEPLEKHSTTTFFLLVGFSYGIILAFLIQTEIMFSFEGIGDLLLLAISSVDYYVINAIIFLMSISFPVIITLILIVFFRFGKVKKNKILKQTNSTPLNTNNDNGDINNREFPNNNSTEDNSN